VGFQFPQRRESGHGQNFAKERGGHRLRIGDFGVGIICGLERMSGCGFNLLGAVASFKTRESERGIGVMAIYETR
jgi:hypothetical protein